MKALLMKDFYTLWRQLRVYLLVMLVISVFNGSFGNIFITIWAALLPYTAMAYDERSKWDQMAAMMPYSTRDIVISKYVLGCCASLCVLAITLPLMFRFGVEKGRLMMFLIIFLVCGSAGALSSIAVSVDHTAGGLSGPFAALMAVLPIAAAALTAVSVPLSMKFYARREA